MTKKLKRFYRGLRRKEAQQKQDGLRPATTGQEAMPHRLFVWLCDYFIRTGNIFAWSYLTLGWNSMCRTSSVADIHLQHLAPVEEDSLGLRVPKSKGDQTGARAHIAWHLYANPLDFRQCCVTALAALLAMDELHDSDKLFTGTNQERRFALAMQKALATKEGKALMRELGRTAIAPHSLRKGSAAFASNGSTYAANFLAICLRAGWSLGDVLGRYFKYDGPMDAFLGRILAGLDVNSPAFATLPPRFVNTVEDTLIVRCFPAFQESFLGVLRFVLPSLVHHQSKLAQMLPKRHRLHTSVLFMDSKLRLALSTTIADSLTIKATGVPPHVTVLRQGASIESKIDRLTTHLLAPAAPVPIPVPLVIDTPAPPPLVGFPEDFELPLVGPFTAWRLLLLGDKDRGLPPFHLLNPKSFPKQRNLRKRLSEWKYLFNTIVAKLDVDVETLVEEDEVAAAFLCVWNSFDFGATKGNKRPDQWKLPTVILKLREMAKEEKPGPTPDVIDLLEKIKPRVPRIETKEEPLNEKDRNVDYNQFFQ